MARYNMRSSREASSLGILMHSDNESALCSTACKNEKRGNSKCAARKWIESRCGKAVEGRPSNRYILNDWIKRYIGKK